MLKPCKLNLITSADGQEASFSKEARFELSENGAAVFYADSEAEVSLYFYADGVRIAREGDYSLRLTLKTGKETEGMLGIAGAQGAVGVFTHKADYRIGKNSLISMLEYDLLMSGGVQKMKVRLAARGEDSEEK